MSTTRNLTAALAFGLFAAAAQAATPPATTDSQTGAGSSTVAPTSTTDNCPKGTISGPDGECVKEKAGRMGFDLAAPSDDAAPAATTSNAGTRGIKKHHQ